ncbi:MAG: type III pantothenate kinase [Actinobacteria bacterium]|nr:type III pantothenate kinase [Actinomycetota bacterium]MBL7197537.1 type III pantothenate kinase [Candidatus Omnitrophota bacterium]
MLLVIDIGNTNISCGLFNSRKLIKVWKILTSDFLFRRRIVLGKFKKIKQKNIEAIIICSVVPEVTEKLNFMLKKIFFVRPVIVGKDLKIPIRNLYKNPRQVGQDRLVGAYSGYKLYGCPLIIVDFGTTITFDVVSRNKKYLGGIILPGIEMSLESLFNKTALLPKVKLNKIPQSLIGRDTVNSILSGIFFGFGSLCEGLIQKIKNKIGGCKVVATGGYARIMSKYCKCIDRIDDELTLKGLATIYNKEHKNKHK